MIWVMLVDDQREVRDGLTLMMSKFADLHVVSRCANGAEAMEELRCLDASGAALPDVVLMDVRMPVMDGIDATRRIVRSWPSVRVLVLTTYDQDDYAFGALAVGASGFLLKDSAVGAIVGAIRSVAAGDAVLSPRVTRELIARVIPNRTPSASDRFSVLPPRELKMAELVSEGLSNAEIAERLSIEASSVKRSITRILSKLGLRDRVQIAVAWYKAGRFS